MPANEKRREERKTLSRAQAWKEGLASRSVSSLAAYEIRRHSGLPNALPGTSAT